MKYRTTFLFLLLAASPAANAEETIPLWPEGHPALEGLDAGNLPSLTVHRPADGVTAMPVVIIVCPGGGYAKQTMGDEGHHVAKWYAKHGITGVTLKYRLPKRGKWSPEKEWSTLRDAQRAVSTVRHLAGKWGLDSPKVGVLGFSAGGHLASMTATKFRAGSPDAEDPVERIGSRPDFACLIYPVISFMDHGHGGSRDNLLGPNASEALKKRYSGEFNVTGETPPIFAVHANNDPIKADNSFVFYQALNKQGIPVELHITSRGGHGFFRGRAWGVPGNPAHRFTTVGSWWPVWSMNWMQAEKLAPDAAWAAWRKRQAATRNVVDPE